ncbi:hypothetical protein JCM10207_005922 [Rhodosporidiobolus poonsookiae]
MTPQLDLDETYRRQLRAGKRNRREAVYRSLRKEDEEDEDDSDDETVTDTVSSTRSSSAGKTTSAHATSSASASSSAASSSPSSGSGAGSASASSSSSDATATATSESDQSALKDAGISTFLGNNTGGIASWYHTDSGTDSTNGRSWCEFPYDDTVPGFAPSLNTMLSSFDNDATATKTGLCGLEAKVYSPATGKTVDLIIADAFDDDWVLTPASIDVIYGSFAELFGESTDDKNDVVKDVWWTLTGGRNEHLTQAIRTTPAFIRQGNPADPSHRSPPSHVYALSLSPSWCVGSVAHGGYLLSVLTSTVTTHQGLVRSPHGDPAHLTSHFFSASVPGKAQVEVRTVSATKRWTRLDVELWQWTPDPNTTALTDPKNERVLRIQAHYLVTTLPPLSGPGEYFPPGMLNYLARPCPLLDHPGALDMTDGGTVVPPKLRFNKGMRWKVVDVVPQDEGTLCWGAWIEMVNGEDLRDSAALIPFFADVAKNGPEMLPESQRAGISWFPTMTLSLDFKSRFPLPASLGKAKRTFGIYSTTKSMHDGRHDLTVEVWSAPADLGAGVEDGKGAERGGEWRMEESRLVGVSTQMALTVPLEVNLKRGGGDGSKKVAEPKQAKL